jgi:hypothetical protein
VAPWHASKYVRVGAIVVIAAVAAVILALVVGRTAGSSPTSTTTSGTVTGVGPVVLNASGLKARVAGLNQPIYWLGPIVGDSYELTRTTADDVYVRYVPVGTAAGTHEGEYPLVATYPYKGALAGLKAAHIGKVLPIAGAKGAIAVVEKGKPTNIHIAYPHTNYQMEIYDPDAHAARTLATSGFLKPVP